MNEQILIIEDDPAILKVLQRGLAYEGYTVDVATDGRTGLNLAHDHHPDMVILDWMLPGMDGLEVCRRLRLQSGLPILMLTAKDTIQDRVQGLDAGADDYIVKPFNLDELTARIRALFRRTQTERNQVYTFADLTMNSDSRQVTRGKRLVPLTAKEYELLELFLRHPRQVLTREVIFDRVWGYDFGGESNVLEVYIRYLRQKLEEENESRLIHTVRSVGYVLARIRNVPAFTFNNLIFNSHGGYLAHIWGAGLFFLNVILITQIDDTLIQTYQNLLKEWTIGTNGEIIPSVMTQLSMTTNVSYQVWDQYGHLRFSSPNLGTFIQPLDSVGVRPKTSIYHDAYLSLGRLRVLTVPLEAGGRPMGILQVASSMDVIDLIRRALLEIIAITAAASMALAASASWFAIGQALSPLSAVTATALQISRTDDLSQRIPNSGSKRDETGQFIDAFNETLAAIGTNFHLPAALPGRCQP